MGVRLRLLPRKADAQARHHDIFQDREAAKQADTLERPRQTRSGDPMRLPARNVIPIRLDPAGGRRRDPGNYIDQGRLAGSIRANEAEDLAAIEAQADVVERTQLEEPL